MTDEFSNFLIENILEHSPVAVLVVNEAGKMIFVNLEARALFGYAKEEMLNQEVETLLPKNLRDKHRQQRADYLSSHTGPRLMGIGRDLFGVHKDGNMIPVEIGLNPISIMNKVFVVATVINITERKRREDHQLNRLIHNLERSNRELEEYAHIISHDLQNPLSIVYSYAEALESEVNGEHQELISKIKGAVNRMSRLTNNLLELSRTVSQKPQFQLLDLNDLIKEVIEELQIQIEETKAAIVVDHLKQIEGDPTLLRELFQNLITNASKYCKPDITPHIHIQGEIDGEFYVIEVEDNGIGMENTSQIFTIFHRLSESQTEVSGSGIGLAVCKKIVDLHHGEISVKSTLGKGTTFSVGLPIKQE